MGSSERQHEVVRDASLTFAHILKTRIPPELENRKQQVEIFFEVPDPKRLDKVRSEGKIPISLILIEIIKSTHQQTTEQPIVREEDPNTGEITEFKMGSPTYMMPRYMITSWCTDPLVDQVVIGLVMKVFFTHQSFRQEDIQGQSISPDSNPIIFWVESITLEKQMRFWQVMGHPLRASVCYAVNVRLDSMVKTFVRRVKERVLDFKKLEG